MALLTATGRITNLRLIEPEAGSTASPRLSITLKESGSATTFTVWSPQANDDGTFVVDGVTLKVGGRVTAFVEVRAYLNKKDGTAAWSLTGVEVIEA